MKFIRKQFAKSYLYLMLWLMDFPEYIIRNKKIVDNQESVTTDYYNSLGVFTFF